MLQSEVMVCRFATRIVVNNLADAKQCWAGKRRRALTAMALWNGNRPLIIVVEKWLSAVAQLRPLSGETYAKKSGET
jgi:hypothetical protein